jgi:chromosome segregation ATPase
VPTRSAAEIERPEVEDELAARRRTVLRAVELVEVTDDALAANEDAEPAPGNETKALRKLRQAEEELAALEAAHWTTEFELADAEAAVEAAEDALSELDSRRMEARRDKVTAQRHLSEARSRQRHAVSALAEARRRLESAREAADGDE